MTMLGNTESVLGRTDVLEQSFKRKEKVMNSSDEIALTVSANGTSKDEATKIALRSAIEQAYGAFVSSNTTILDDELIKDEIVTISKGNIKSYKEVASAILPNGLNTVTLQAVVSISNLVSYAKSKGASAEFSGASFGMGMKIKELNKENEMIALNNLLEQVRALLPTAFDKELIIEEPKVTSAREISRPVLNSQIFHGYDDKKELFWQQWISSADNSYLMELGVKFIENKNALILSDLINSTLKSIALTKEEVEEYERQNVPQSKLRFWAYWDSSPQKIYSLRSTYKDIESWAEELLQIFAYEFADFKIVDNLGAESSFDAYTIINFNDLRRAYILEHGKKPFFLNDVYGHSNEYHVEGKELFKGASVKTESILIWRKQRLKIDYRDMDVVSFQIPIRFYWEVKFLIKKDDIMKYNNFTIERKN